MSNDRQLPPRWDDMVPLDAGQTSSEQPTDAADTKQGLPMRRRQTVTRRVGPFVAGVAAAFVALWLFAVVSPPPRPLSLTDVGQQVQNALGSLTPGPPDSEFAYQQVALSLVLVESQLPNATGIPAPGASPADNNAIGSGVVIDAKSDVLTALHVVANASSVQVTFADGSSADVDIVREIPENDIAVLRPTSAVGAPAAILGDPNRLHIGSEAFVVGNPFGLYGSLSAGVVSGLDRSFRMPDSTTVLNGLIQVDAAVNPGNSGGPLLDANGLVVGVVTALVNPSPDHVFAGIGLAVPIDVVSAGIGLPPD